MTPCTPFPSPPRLPLPLPPPPRPAPPRAGITGYPLAALRYLAEHATVPVATCISYCRMNLHDRSLVTSGTLALLQSKGIAVINASPLSMGILTHRGPPAWHPSKAALKVRAAAAAAYCAERGVDISHLALSFCLEVEGIPTTMISTASLARLRHDVEVTQGLHPLTAEERAISAEVVKRFFSGEAFEAEGLAAWEGAEVEAYWGKVGRSLMEQWYAAREAARAAGGEAPSHAAVAAGAIAQGKMA